MLFAGGPVKSDSEIIYKEVIEDGKTITRQFKFLHYYEYNSDGKKIYEKRSKDIPERRNCQMLWMKNPEICLGCNL